MIQRRSGPCFPSESFQHHGVSRYQLGQEFKSYKAAQLGVLSLVNHTHPAASQLFNDPVVRNGVADHQGLNLMKKSSCESMKGGDGAPPH